MSKFRYFFHLRPGRLASCLRVARLGGDQNTSTVALADASSGEHVIWNATFSVSCKHGMRNTDHVYTKPPSVTVDQAPARGSSEKDSSVFNPLFDTKFAFDHKTVAAELQDLGRQMRERQNAGESRQLSSLVSRERLKVLADHSFSTNNPVYLRSKCLSVLLTQDTDDELTEKALAQVLASKKQLPFRVMAGIAMCLSSCPQTPLRQTARRELVTSLVTQRWYEIQPTHAVFFMYELDHLYDMRALSKSHIPQLSEKKTDGKIQSMTASNSISVNLESHIISLVDRFKVKDLARIVMLSAKWRNRNETLLNAAVHRICQADLDDFSFIQLNNLLHACSVLRIQNQEFLKKLCQALSACSPPSPSLAVSMLTSLSYLCWKDMTLISSNLDKIRGHAAQLSLKEAGSVIMSLANLYPVPMTEQNASLVRELVSQILPACNLRDKVTYIWCSAVLHLLDSQLATQVLHRDCVQKLLEESGEGPSGVYHQRLRQINTSAQLDLLDYTGPLLSEDVLRSLYMPKPSIAEKLLYDTLVKALGKFTHLETYVNLAINLPHLGQIDAVMLANGQGKVCPLSDADRSQDTYKLAIQVVPFSGVLGSDQSTTGMHQLNCRILSKLGYIPVQILYSDLHLNQTALEHVNNIQSRITGALRVYGLSIKSS